MAPPKITRPTWGALKRELMPRLKDTDLPRKVRRRIAIARLHLRRKRWTRSRSAT